MYVMDHLDAFTLVLEEVEIFEDAEVVSGRRSPGGLIARSARHLLGGRRHR